MRTSHKRGFRLNRGQWLTLRRVRKRLRASDHSMAKRLRAIELVGHDGLTQEAAARVLEVGSRAIRSWVSKYRKGGIPSLVTGKAKGAKPKLTPGQKRELARLIRIGPERCGFDTGVWTGKIVAALIWRKFRVRYHPAGVGRILRDLGFTRQRPQVCIAKANPAVRAKWWRVTIPRLRTHAKRVGGVILAGDEATFQQKGTVHQTWAVRGVGTEAVSQPCRRTQKVIGAVRIGPRPGWHFRFAEKFNTATMIEFLSHLVRHYCGRMVFLLWDNAGYHKSDELKEWLRKRRNAIRLVYFPPYSPDLNPTETIWRETKRHATHNRYFKHQQELHDALFRRFNRYQGNPGMLMGTVRPLAEAVHLNA